MQKNITATIITLNEEKHIKAVIESALTVCSDVVVIDSFSTDKTVEIAKSLGAKIVQNKFLGDGPQRILGEPLADHDWILSIDADERLDDNAIEEISALDLEATSYDAFSIKRRSFVGKNEIKQWYPDRVIRLYNKTKCTFPTDKEHGGDADTKNYTELNSDLLHYSFPDFATLVRKADRFAVNLAHIRFNEGKRASWYDPFIHGIGAFFKGMIFKGGIFGGAAEWHVGVQSAYNSYMKYVIMLELQENEKNEK